MHACPCMGTGETEGPNKSRSAVIFDNHGAARVRAARQICSGERISAAVHAGSCANSRANSMDACCGHGKKVKRRTHDPVSPSLRSFALPALPTRRCAQLLISHELLNARSSSLHTISNIRHVFGTLYAIYGEYKTLRHVMLVV